MPWIPFYAVEADILLIEQLLVSDPDIAFIINEHGDRWRAVPSIHLTGESYYSLWHVPSGPLPLYSHDAMEPIGQIDDPSRGWTQLVVTDGRPYFGPGHGGMLGLTLSARKPGEKLEVSSFEWIGNHFWALGRLAPPETQKRWNKLRRQLGALGPKVPRIGGVSSREGVIALPGALAEIARVS